MPSGGMALDGGMGVTYAFTAIRLKLAFSQMFYSTFNYESL